MNTPDPEGKHAETPAEKPTGTPLTDSLQEAIPKGAKPGVLDVMWETGFQTTFAMVREFTKCVRLRGFDKPYEENGQKFFWTVELVDLLKKDLKTVVKFHAATWHETKEEADLAFEKGGAWLLAEKEKIMVAQAAAASQKTSSDDQDLVQARLKVMREHFPDTHNALDAMAQATQENRAEATEALFRAFAVDLVRLRKPKNLGDVSPFQSPPGDLSFILEIAKAYKAKSPFDPVTAEIAANWFAAGYDKMSLAEYTDAINAKTGASISPDAMEKRRYAKLGLMTKKLPGPPQKS